MASLTPGTLQKLLQNVGNKGFKVAGEHRSALLQVISIMPSLDDDPWKSRGYFLRVSDSIHSAYVSVSDEDVDLILSDKIQLGQFIHVTRLDSGSPVPFLRGIKPVPKRRPCIGDPKDLISSDFLNAKKVETKVKLNGKVKKAMANKEGSNRRLSVGNGEVKGMENRRLSLDSARKAWDRSPQSKNVGKGLKPNAKDTSPFSVPQSVNGGQRVKPKSKDNSSLSDSVVTNKVLLNNSPNTPRISPLKNNNIVVSPKVLTKPVRSPVMQTLKSSDDDAFPNHFKNMALSSIVWSDSKIAWSSLPSTISDLGKEVRSYRNAAYVSAICALEEASISESVIQCMSMFAEICESSKKDSSGLLVQKYLNLHESMKRTAAVINSMINTRISNAKNKNDPQSQFSEETNKNASLWVQAAMKTDLSRFSLYSEGENSFTEGQKRHYVVIEKGTKKTDTKIPSPKNASRKSLPKTDSKKLLTTQKEIKEGKEGLGLREVSILSKNLLTSSRAWFLDYLEDSLNKGFGVKRSEESSHILGQLKRVNKWFDDAFQGGEGADERIDRLRNKLYGFLLNHVDSATLRK